jgi:tRNA nucleotidyltransferase (CCA-adding enzyme)
MARTTDYPSGAKVYLVGGAVRDQLLGLPVHECDWVVTGVTPEAMLAAGFQAVGRDFPVFLHPQSKDEVALARTEKKRGRGYHGFVFHADATVRLEQDLVRRDLTINALAQGADGQIIDVCGGREDLDRRYLRHIGLAFVEDPLRLLRLARFAARFASLGFRVHSDTEALLLRIVDSGELTSLARERLWQETRRAMACAHPEVFFALLNRVGALDVVLPRALLADFQLDSANQALRSMVPRSSSIAMRFAAWLAGGGVKAQAIDALASHLSLPRQLSQWMQRVLRADLPQASGEQCMALFDAIDLWRQGGDLSSQLTWLRFSHGGSMRFWRAVHQAAHAALAIKAQGLLAQGLKGKAVGEALREQRRRLIDEKLHQADMS